jgi:hypothetical protein
MARPRKKIDPDQVRQLAAIGCSQSEIGSILKCSVDTLKRRFADAIKDGELEGNASLKRMQWIAAKNGNVTMQIWLGKQRLGQSDKVETKNDDTFHYDDKDFWTLEIVEKCNSSVQENNHNS